MNNKTDESPKPKSVLWSKDYILLVIVNVFSAFSFNMVSTILSKYFVTLGIPLTLAGIILGVFSIMALVIRPVSGLAADRFNKKYILIAANFLIGVSVLGYTISNSVAVIFIFRILHGFAFGMSGTASIAMASENIPRERTGEGLGYVALGQILAVAVAPGIGIEIANRFGYNASFYASFLLAVVASLLLLAFKQKKSPDKPKVPAKISIHNIIAKEAIFFSIISGVMSLNNGIVNAFILLFAEQNRITDIGAYFLVSAAVMFVIRPMSGRILDKKGLSILIYPAFAIGIAGMVLHGLSSTLWLLLVAAAFKAAASATIQASLQAECIIRAGVDRSGVATSTYFIGADIGQGIGPMIGGAIASAFGYRVMFYFCAVTTFIGVTLFFISNRRNKNRSAIEPNVHIHEQIGDWSDLN